MILPAIDMHVHLWQGNLQSDKATLLAMLERYEIAWLGVIPLWGGQYPSADEIIEGNRTTAEFCRANPQTCKQFVTINPCQEQLSLDEIQRGYDEAAIAVKIWVATRADDPTTFPVAEKCIELGLPLLLHAFHKTVGQLAHETDAQHVAMLAKRYPELKIIMAHLAGQHLWGCPIIADCPNVWSDFSGSYCEQDTVETAIKYLGEDRVLFGSDAPGADFLVNLAKVEEADITDAQRRKILHDNSTRLFNRASLTGTMSQSQTVAPMEAQTVTA